MTVEEVMHRSPTCCNPGSNLASAAQTMRSIGCRALPVTNSDGTLAGLVTDRDICMAVACGDRRAADLTVGEVMMRNAPACHIDDEIHSALDVMRWNKAERLAVLDAGERVEGVLCAHDLVLSARHNDGRSPDLSYEDMMKTLKAINRH